MVNYSSKKILIIITGSIAAYKSMDLIRLLKKAGHEVSCILTKGAQEFITPLLVSALVGEKVYSELFSLDEEAKMGHIKLARNPDLIIVAPASADFIAKMANGYCDDLASTVISASDRPIMVAPAMNEKMWLNNATQDNISKLIAAKISIIHPQEDFLACGEFGVGKMAAPEIISDKVSDFFEFKDQLKGVRVMITAGSTIEEIDPVRYISNYSSGKQAFAIANCLIDMGADVAIIAGRVDGELVKSNHNIIWSKSATQMHEQVMKNIIETDVFIGCAAVCDYAPEKPSKSKIKKSSVENISIKLVQNPDILFDVGNSQNRPQIVIGFAAESDDLEKNAKEKLIRKNCDMIVANQIAGGKIFGSKNSDALIIKKSSIKDLGQISKIELAKEIADEIVKKINLKTP